MATRRAGLKQLALCDLNTLDSAPVDPIVAGIRNGATMARTPFKEVKDYLNRVWPNMTNFNVQWESLQPSMFYLKKLIEWLNRNCDAQIITRPQSAGGPGDVYKFTGNNAPGLDFEYVITQDKRSIKPTLEFAIEKALAQALITDAGTNTAVAFDGITGEGVDQTKYRAPYFLSFKAPSGTPLFLDKRDISERSYSIKTKNKKGQYNDSIVDYLTFEYKITARDASIAKQIEIMSKDASPSILVQEQNRGVYYDAFDFAPGVLTLHDEFNDGDDDSTLVLTFAADVHIYDIAFLFGNTYGGDTENASGIVGGTMKIGY